MLIRFWMLRGAGGIEFWEEKERKENLLPKRGGGPGVLSGRVVSKGLGLERGVFKKFKRGSFDGN